MSSRWMEGKIYRATGRKLAEIGWKEGEEGKEEGWTKGGDDYPRIGVNQ